MNEELTFDSPLQAESHFKPVTLWQAAMIFPIFYADRYEERQPDGRLSLAAFMKARAETVNFWADQLLASRGRLSHPYFEGFVYTSIPGETGSSATWGIHPFRMAKCIQKFPPELSDYEYSESFLLSSLTKALPEDQQQHRHLYDVHFWEPEEPLPPDWMHPVGSDN